MNTGVLKNEFTMLKSLLLTLAISISVGLSLASAEGTKQIMPFPDRPCALDINNPELTKFATYLANDKQRLQISIKDPVNEAVYLGFGVQYKNSSVYTGESSEIDMYYRIKDPSGNVVKQGRLPRNRNDGAGFIAEYNEAIIGPAPIAGPGGYNPMIFQPAVPGDFYIEFNPYSQDTAFGQYGGAFKIKYFDITVHDKTTTTAIDGRVWSKSWSLSALGGLNPINAEFYVQTNDSLVTKLGMNGMQPWGFALTCNSYGVRKSGNSLEDRRSEIRRVTDNEEYRIFLNPPDLTYFRTGVPAEYSEPPTIDGCNEDEYYITLSSSKEAVFEVFFDLNGIPGFQLGSDDRRIERKVIAGRALVRWDGKTGRGTKVPDGTYKVQVTLASGLTHLPIWDAEYNNNGLIVEPVRPLTARNRGVRLRWDDTKIPCESDLSRHYNFDGFPSPGHSWNTTDCDVAATGTAIITQPGAGWGNIRTINSWWPAYAEVDTLLVTVKSCSGPTGNQRPQFRKNEIIVQAGGTPVTTNIRANNTDPDGVILCDNSTSITRFPMKGTVIMDPLTCALTYSAFAGTSGTDTVFVEFCDNGTPPRCGTDTLVIRIQDGPIVAPDDVEIPEGFSPNGDGVNDNFVIKGLDGKKCRLEIYNRWGALVYLDEEYTNDWNGRSNSDIATGGGFLPDGIYFYKIDYGKGIKTRSFVIKR